MTLTGILNINKDASWTSFQIVALVRKETGMRRVGHAGTLDPQATGVLLVCLGQATRISQYLMELPKSYRANITLGTATDTYDAEGRPTFTGGFHGITEGDLRAALARFVGPIQQVPPSFSAIKVGGQPAYRLARKGQPPELASRTARIDRIDLLCFRPPRVELEIQCGKGTYIRSLAHDLGQALGCGAHLAGLTRTRIGPFVIDDALSLTQLQGILQSDTWRQFLLPMDRGLAHLPAATLEPWAQEALRCGRPLSTEVVTDVAPGGRCRAYGHDGSFIAIIAYDDNSRLWRPEKVFSPL